jgi:hypothetical protein
MEYCSGGSLRDKISTNTFTATEAIEWIQTPASLRLIIKENNTSRHQTR